MTPVLPIAFPVSGLPVRRGSGSLSKDKGVCFMEKISAFLKRKNIVFSAKRYGIDALGAMAQGLFCSLLIGTILNTLGSQFHIGFLTAQIAEKVPYTVGGLTSFMSGPAMAIAIGYALQAPPLVLFSLAAVGYACNLLGGAGGPLAVLFVAIIAAECGKAVSKETKIDILVTPIVTTLIGVGAAYLIAPPIGTAASAFGTVIMKATELQPFLMGILVSVLVGIALTLPISSAAICSVLGLTGLLRPDGRLRRHEFPGKRLGRTGQSGAGHLHAADAQHREKSQSLDCPHRHLRHYRPHSNLPVPAGDERRRHQLRHGHLRTVRAAGGVDRLGISQ